jgi:hypothetical protein
MDRQNIGRIVALCGVQGCCPTAEFTEVGVVLRDDYQGMVKFTDDEWQGFLAKAKSGELG